MGESIQSQGLYPMAAMGFSGVECCQQSEEMASVERHRDEDEEEEQVEGWDDWETDEDESRESYFCLFCEATFYSGDDLFSHCRAEHSFDFYAIKKNLQLDFYGCVKLINYVRAQVAKNKSWTWEDSTARSDDIYLKPVVPDDALLHSLPSDDDEDDHLPVVDKDELMRELISVEGISHICNIDVDMDSLSFDADSHCCNGVDMKQDVGTSHMACKDTRHGVHFSNASARKIKSVNADYFESYSSFGIHREMISDKVRTETYRDAILTNPALLKGATVLDVGCGTGILSLFAAQAGASMVIAVDASEKMASVASQIAKDNGLCSERINVVQGMIEDLDEIIQVPPNSIDILVSEWMGYCLLYESMLSSVLYARDRWLKHGGAIFPDIATIFAAGFSRGSTSFPFWEDVYGFDMSTIGREVLQNAAKFPIVDVVNSHDIITETVSLKTFDLATMTREEMDFTSSIELLQKNGIAASGVTWCYGIVLWFDTFFSSRFCKEKQYTLSTSPYSPKTHWYQTIFTFNEAIALGSSDLIADDSQPVGTERCPAFKIGSRISIVRSTVHRSIDISLEITALGFDGKRRILPAQVFNL